MDLEVKFDGEEISVTRPGTDMMTAYRKRSDTPTSSPGRLPLVSFSPPVEVFA